jgi:cobalt-zinc-cadmium efflux system outer membrane protein
MGETSGLVRANAPPRAGFALRQWSMAVLCVTMPLACASVPPQARPDPAVTAQAFQARGLEALLPGAPPAASGWDRAQWLNAALLLNPQLAEARARAAAVAAGERTAAQRPNPTLNLFDEYVTAAAGGAAWLYGLSVDFLLQRPGERSRARATAALQTQAAQSDVAEAIWQVRAQLRQALLDLVHERDERAMLLRLLSDREGLLASARARARAGESGVTEIAPATLELVAAPRRLDQARAREADARARLAAAVGVPLAALSDIAPLWPQWDDIAALTPAPSDSWREEALIARPDIVRTLREYDLAENALRSELARRWPAIHVEPGYAWDRGGLHENQLNENLRDNELGMSLELPLFNRNEGPIGEAVARRTLAGKHLEAVQAELFGQMQRAESAWPRARLAWQNAQAGAALAQRQDEAQQRALKAGASDRPSALLAASAALEGQWQTLEAAYEAQQAFAALEDAYRRPLEGPECALPGWRTE